MGSTSLEHHGDGAVAEMERRATQGRRGGGTLVLRRGTGRSGAAGPWDALARDGEETDRERVTERVSGEGELSWAPRL